MPDECQRTSLGSICRQSGSGDGSMSLNYKQEPEPLSTFEVPWRQNVRDTALKKETDKQNRI